MQLTDFSFDLPDELIARYPLPERSSSRLLVLHGANGAVEHKRFTDLLDYLDEGDLLVFNNTRVIPARLNGHKATGGKVEILIERITSEREALCHIKASKSPKPEARIHLENGAELEVTGRDDNLFLIKLVSEGSLIELCHEQGHMPLPPYIDRPDEDSDKERYQTVYSEKEGAVAAPTAGLHFTDELLEAIKERGVELGFVTLHVGAGTFLPVRVDKIEEHRMHSEYYEVTEELAEQVNRVKARGNKVFAVGTTSVRTLETVAQPTAEGDYQMRAASGDTDIFIYPGYDFKIVDALITNFHLPEPTLLMLISALVDRETILSAYEAAVDERYRFFSYGDSMLILPESHHEV